MSNKCVKVVLGVIVFGERRVVGHLLAHAEQLRFPEQGVAVLADAVELEEVRYNDR